MSRRHTVTFNLPMEIEELKRLRSYANEYNISEDEYEEGDDEGEDESDDDEDGPQSRSSSWYNVTDDSDSACSTQEYLESLAALRRLRRASLANLRRTSTISTASAFIKEALHANDADDTWSLKYLRRRFKRKDQENLFEKYQLRLRYVFFVVYLMLQITLSGIQVVSVLYAIILNQKKSVEFLEETFGPSTTVELIGYFLVFSMAFLFLGLNYNEEFFMRVRPYHLLMSIFLIGSIVSFNSAFSLYFLIKSDDGKSYVKVGNIIYNLIGVYLFLPILKNLNAVIVGVGVSLLHFGFSLVFHFWREEIHEACIKAVADVLILAVVNIAGVYTRYINEITFRRVFLNRKGNLESKIKLEKAKQQEEALLLSVLPKTVMQKVKEDYRRYIYEGKLNSNQLFRNRYLSRHDDVSILYADIVNFTVLTTKLEVEKLVEVLNDLFEKFDQEAEKNSCLRIKILGDCYYCVSGVPEETEFHANNCIRMGLRMIEIIQKVRTKFEADVDMRIGIHSGSVLCGIIGLLKFQYDVWGDDVSIANRMEQTGKAGRVHVSGKTLSYVKNKEFEVESYPERESDPLLDSQGVESFLILHRNRRRASSIRRSFSVDESEKNLPLIHFHKIMRSASYELGGEGGGSPDASCSSEVDFHNYCKQSMDAAIKSMPLNKVEQWFRVDDINPITLNFRQKNWNVPLIFEKDLLFKFYVLSCLPFTLSVTLFQAILMKEFSMGLSFGLFSFLFLLVVLTPICLVSFGLFPYSDPELIGDVVGIDDYHYYYDDDDHEDERKKNKDEEAAMGGGLGGTAGTGGGDAKRESRQRKVFKVIGSVSKLLMDSFLSRLILYFTLMVLLSATSFTNMLECEVIAREAVEKKERHLILFAEQFGHLMNSSGAEELLAIFDYFMNNQPNVEIPPLCCNPWYFTYSCVLVLVAAFGFFRIFFVIKLCVYILVTITYSLFMFVYTETLFSGALDECPTISISIHKMRPQIDHLFFVLVIFFTLHAIDRQMEYIIKLNFKWKENLKKEQEEAGKTRRVNKTLLENIMPQHVAEFFLTRLAKQNLYHEKHEWVAVIFASIPNYSEFHRANNDRTIKRDEKSQHMQQEEDERNERSLQVLNAIVIDFDELKEDQRFQSIEKIKVIGSTYMAACGLQLDCGGELGPPKESEKNETVNTLAVFASAMFDILAKINEESWQNFHLRIGMAVGPVIAGVLGNKKPHYDIWGDAVNVASRMDSNGVNGKIHVTETVGKILESLGWGVESRGNITVKGKGTMPTFLVDPRSVPFKFNCDSTTKRSPTPVPRSILKNKSHLSKANSGSGGSLRSTPTEDSKRSSKIFPLDKDGRI